MSERRNSLLESFRDCAPFCTIAPVSPYYDPADMLQQEMIAQLINATIELLSRNYGFSGELSKCKISVGYGYDQTPDGEAVHTIFATCNEDKAISGKKLSEWRQRADAFENNFIECTSRIEGVYIGQPQDLEILTIAFQDPRDLWKGLWIMTDNLHPDNKAAMSHIRTIVHLNDRVVHEELKRRLI